jgi:DNA-binding NarL/FixJ family response regulator
MQTKTQVMLVEDHPEYREVIQLALQDEDDIELADQVGSAERAISILKNTRDRRTPDVILLDLNLPGISGLEVIPSLYSLIPEAKIIILSQSGSEIDVIRAIQQGASGYLLKSSTVAQILDAIRTVMMGGATLDSNVAKYVLSSLRSKIPHEELEHALSQRELEILSLIGNGLLKKEVAQNLGISVSTVATYIRRIYEKLDVQNAPAAVAKAYRIGLFPTDAD